METINKKSLSILKEPFEVYCEDGVLLKGTLLIPEKPKAILQFNSATAVKKEFYFKFAEYVAGNGFIVCLWDYRGVGESINQELKNCAYSYIDYGTKDMPTIKEYLKKRYPNLPYLIAAHSTGGQQIGFMNNIQDVKGVINFAVSSGYYDYMPLAYRLRTYFFFYFFAPISIKLYGYVRAKKYNFMEDLPKNVLYQWRTWCSKKDCFFSPDIYGVSVPKGNFKQFNFPIQVYWSTDDTISNQKNMNSFWRHIKTKKSLTFSYLSPQNIGVPKIGHLGFFKKSMKDKLWNSVVDNLNTFVKS